MSTTSPTRTSRRPAGRWSRPLAAAGLAAGLVAASTSAANAQVLEHPDAAGDMIKESYETGESQPAPNHARDDALSTTLSHTARRVSVRVQYTELQRVGDANLLFVPMVTDEGVRRSLEVTAGPGDWAGDAEMFGRRERSVRCAIRVSMNYADNVTTVSFPRRCLSSPRWVKFQVASLTFEGDSIYVDDDLSDEPPSEDSTLAQSERVFRAGSS